MGKALLLMLGLVLGLGGPLRAEWPEQAVSLVSALPLTLPWSDDQANPQALIVKALVPRLSRELGVPVTLVERPQGQGVLAANLVAGSKPDGYLLGALGPDPALTRVIQGYTPYTWAEITPAATAWRAFPAIVVRAENPADDLLSLAGATPAPRLAHTGLAPVEADTYLALAAARRAGFSWRTVPVDKLDPAVLLNDQAEALVLPLGWLAQHPQADRFKILTILTYDENPPCGQGRPTLRSQGLEGIAEEPPLTLYLPAKVNWRIRSRLMTAINNSLRQPAVSRSISEACLKLYIEDLDGSTAVMNQAYNDFETGLAALAPAGGK